MGLARSTYYFELGRQDRIAIKNMPLMNQIKDIFVHHKGRYGVRRVYHELVNQGYSVNHKRVQRLMHAMGLAGLRPKEKYHSYKGIVGPIAIYFTGIFIPLRLWKNGQPIYHSLPFLGENATCLRFWICIPTKLSRMT